MWAVERLWAAFKYLPGGSTEVNQEQISIQNTGSTRIFRKIVPRDYNGTLLLLLLLLCWCETAGPNIGYNFILGVTDRRQTQHFQKTIQNVTAALKFCTAT